MYSCFPAGSPMGNLVGNSSEVQAGFHREPAGDVTEAHRRRRGRS